MKRFFLIFALLFFAAGCGQTALHHSLQEIEADEILVVLSQNGIEANKKKEEGTGQDITWMVSVPAKEESRSRSILRANNLPRKRELGLSGVYKEKGLIPTPDEQKARFLLALKGEIINSLLKIPGVVDVDIVLNVPNESEFADLDPVKRKPTASVVVKTRNDELVAQTVTEGKVQRFVANTVPNLDANDVAVIVTRTDTGAGPIGLSTPLPTPTPLPASPSLPPEDGEMPSELMPISTGNADVVELAGLKLDRASVARFKGYIITLLLLLVGVSGFLLFNIMRLNRMRLRVQRGMRAERGALGAGGGNAALLGEGAGNAAMDGTFDVGAEQRQMGG
jgi:type III secretion system YscJ/HrcJ family lipoprotein